MTGTVKPHHSGSPDLEFEVNLPAAWNGRALQMGGGGHDGSVVTGLTQYSNQAPDTDPPLKQGYVTLGSDGIRASPASTALSGWMTKRC